MSVKLFLLLACLATPAMAQTVSELADSADELVLDHDFGATGEIARVFLEDKQVYRAELNSPDVTLTLRPRRAGTRIPRVYLVADFRLSSGSSVVAIYPDQDGEYEIWPVRFAGSRIPARLRLYRDVNESGRRSAVAHQPD